MDGFNQCPLTLGNGNPLAIKFCIRTECEWWNSKYDKCAMNVLVSLAEKSEKELRENKTFSKG